MNRRSWLSGLGCLVLSGCLASTTIRTTSSDAVRRSVISVFQAQEFSVLSQSPGMITFQKRGGRSAEIAWTTIDNPNPVMIRPTVRWRSTGSSEFTVTCQVEVAQQSTVDGEIVREPMMMGKSAYNGMLRDVKLRVEGGRGGDQEPGGSVGRLGGA